MMAVAFSGQVGFPLWRVWIPLCGFTMLLCVGGIAFSICPPASLLLLLFCCEGPEYFGGDLALKRLCGCWDLYCDGKVDGYSRQCDETQHEKDRNTRAERLYTSFVEKCNATANISYSTSCSRVVLSCVLSVAPVWSAEFTVTWL
jgi:hypothetical protein